MITVKTPAHALRISTAALVSASLMIGAAGAANASTTNAEIPAATQHSSEKILYNKDQVTELLRIVDQIPEDVLQQGDAATNKWVTANIRPQNAPPEGMASAASFVGCSGAILATIGTTVFPAAKLLKIKRYMNALGGTTEAIKILWGASFNYEKLQALGGTAAALGAELLGITAIKEACT